MKKPMPPTCMACDCLLLDADRRYCDDCAGDYAIKMSVKVREWAGVAELAVTVLALMSFVVCAVSVVNVVLGTTGALAWLLAALFGVVSMWLFLVGWTIVQLYDGAQDRIFVRKVGFDGSAGVGVKDNL